MAIEKQNTPKKPRATKKTPAKVVAKAPEDGDFPELKTLTEEGMYNLVGKFLQKAIPIKGAKLQVIKGKSNRVSTPKPPYIVLQLVDEKQLSTNETRYTDKHKITWSRSEITIDISFYGYGNVSALQMSKAFVVRFNDAWASEQFSQYSDILFPLYCDDLKIEHPSLNAEEQYDNACFVTAYFEYHPEFGICEHSAKEIIMNMQNF